MMIRSLAIALLVSLPAAASFAAEPDHKDAHPDERKSGQATVPADATEGPRDLPAAVAPFRSFVAQQPYGKSWKELVAVAPPPKDQSGIGEAKTHPDLKRDPIELQEQVQYLEETRTESRFGLVSMRGMRAFRYGKLMAVQIVLERIGRDPSQEQKLKEDIEALARAFKDPSGLLGLGPAFTIARNDLGQQPGKAPPRLDKLPLRIEIAPAAGGKQ